MLEGVCAGYWGLLGDEGGGLMKLVRKHGVKAKLQAGLESGLASRRRDWDSEVTMFGQGGGGSVAGVEWVWSDQGGRRRQLL